ncbi:MAG: YqzE family protein [Sporolactobacillus sp.]
MKSEDYVKYLTEQFVRYLETPRTERKKVRQAHRASRPPMRHFLFGQIPDALESYVVTLRNRIKKKR